MLRSMFSAISGLRAHQTKLDVAGNNIANVNTVGFKASQTVFEDTLSQVLRNGSAPNGDVAGTNPAQVGLGVKVAGITTNFGQGSTQNTGRASDFMISGDGFFVTKVGNESLYTRAGSFDTDGVGNLVTPDGAKLQGWMANALGVVDPNGPLQDLRIPTGQVLAPVATTGASLAGNLSAGATDADTAVSSQINMYDDLGNAHPVSVTLSKSPVVAPATTSNEWTVTFADTTTTPATNLLSTTVEFSDGSGGIPAGTLVDPPGGELLIPAPTGTFAAWTKPVTVDLSSLTQFGGKSDAAAKTTAQSGSAMGVLEGYSLANDGTIVGIYSNGLRQNIGQLALATFTNPGGLEKAGNSSYRAGDNSGNPLVGQAGTGGRGSLSAGALEMSNVDLAEEFTGLIVAQRGFQANSRVISTSDEILQDLVQLKR
ncbi:MULTISPECIES: flagellar hook protein FlgE [unclassified Modestobacter]|uniref:flagellar hook protein FlgE n=1 Tax=unclassified Modestobacter TaxID=2643866 RepID=UPI0022AB215E|nr:MULTISPECIES: flagellar hook protein FlgE [unclassified Modestobacter]MCZ2825114.1 flagellar hook protein FlgE [Modestobacter sp. VKM Ac-2981]MCZ2853821.1 flagellar hook protein FlgE [Modestobacter sp. VKM Ac-2982]